MKTATPDENNLISIDVLEGSKLSFMALKALEKIPADTKFNQWIETSGPGSFPTFSWDVFGPLWVKNPCALSFDPENKVFVAHRQPGSGSVQASDPKVAYCRLVVAHKFGFKFDKSLLED